MPNPSGTNQFAGFPTTEPYGDKARQGMLQRLAPIASPPDRPYRRPQKQQAGEAAPPVPVVASGPPQVPAEQLYASIAAIPGASPLVQELFGT